VPSDPSGREEEYDPNTKGKRYTLFSGTTVLQCGDGRSEEKDGPKKDTLALVTNTGINTSKGDILAAILFPTRMTFRYDEELPAAVFLLFLYSIFAFVLSVYFLSTNGASSDFITTWCYAGAHPHAQSFHAAYRAVDA
jgi:cation-transporting ATPase 13A3/4/5